ncbi:MAG: hypothetical protein Q9Q13_02130 [Acidobacteriota bacterium]|nr:hypothetical protein [Acidobacteriota bacterium]
MLEAQADPFLLTVELEHQDVELIADVDHLGRMVHTAPGHVGDVEQTVDATEIDEGSVLCDVLHHALDAAAFLESLERHLLLLGVLLFEHMLAGDDDVAPPAVHLDHPNAHLLVLEMLEIAHGTHIHQRAGQEGANSDIHRQAALDAIDDPPGENLAGAVGRLDPFPDLDPFGLLLGERDVVVVLGQGLDHRLDGVADLDFVFFAGLAELRAGDSPLFLEADVHEDDVTEDLHHSAAGDGTLPDVFRRRILVEQRCEIQLRVGNLLVVFLVLPGLCFHCL